MVSRSELSSCFSIDLKVVLVDQLLVVVAKHRFGSVDQGHPAAELVEDAGELVGDIAPAGDHDPLRQLLEMEHFVRADCMLDAGNVGHQRPRPGGDQDLAGADRLARSQPH